MENANELILLAVSVIITALVIALGLGLVASSRALPSVLVDRTNRTNEYLDEYQYLKYANKGTVKGNEVLTALRKFNNSNVEMHVKIQNKSSNGTYAYQASNGSDPAATRINFSSFQNLPTNDVSFRNTTGRGTPYINPNSEFSVEVTRNTNGYINKLIFTQLSYNSPITVSSLSGTTINIVSNNGVVNRYSAQRSKNLEELVDDTEDTSSANTDEGSDNDTDVIFSDEEPQKLDTKESEELHQFNDEVSSISSAIMTTSDAIEAITEETTQEEISIIRDQVTDIRRDIESLHKKYGNSSNLNQKNKEFVNNSIEDLLATVGAIEESLNIWIKTEESE